MSARGPTQDDLQRLFNRLRPRIARLFDRHGVSTDEAELRVTKALVWLSYRWDWVRRRERWLLAALKKDLGTCPKEQEIDSDRTYDPVFNAAVETAGSHIDEFQREIQAARGLLDELATLSTPERSERVRTEQRFHTLKLCHLLLEKSREAWFSEPSRVVELAELATVVAHRLDRQHYGEGLIEDAKALAWAHLGNAYRISSDFRRAEEALLRAEDHHKRGGEDALTKAQILSFLASLRTSQGRVDSASKLLDEEIALYRDARDFHSKGKALIKKATVLGYAGNHRDAIRLIKKGLSQVNLLEEPRLLVAARHNLIWYLNESGHHEEALSVLQTTRVVYAELGDHAHLVRFRWLEGRIARDLDRFDQAEEALREARDGLIERGTGLDAAFATLDLATVYAKQGRVGELKRLASEIVPVFESRDVHREALAALLLFRQAALAEEVTLGLLERILDDL